MFLCGALFWGILISVIAKSQPLAFQMGILSSFLPAMMLSGFIYAIDDIPLHAGHHLRHFDAYFVTILKGIYIEIGLEVLSAECSSSPSTAWRSFFSRRADASRNWPEPWRRNEEVLRRRTVQTFREPRMRVLLFVRPLVRLIVFGYAVNLDVESARIGWADGDRTPRSRDLRAASKVPGASGWCRSGE